MKKLLAVLMICFGLWTSCSKDSTTNTYTPSCNGTVKSYKTDVAPIIESACASCHQNFGNYSNLYSVRFSVRSQVVSGNMPQNGVLSSTQKDAIACWIDSGAPNN